MTKTNLEFKYKAMSEFSEWFEQTFKDCYCEEGHLIDQDRFSEIAQLVLDNEADEESLALFEEKLRNCVQTSGRFEKEKNLLECIKNKLNKFRQDIPGDLANAIRNSISA